MCRFSVTRCEKQQKEWTNTMRKTIRLGTVLTLGAAMLLPTLATAEAGLSSARGRHAKMPVGRMQMAPSCRWSAKRKPPAP